MSKPSFPFWNKLEDNEATPPGDKQNAGSKSTYPEAAQYVNWRAIRIWRWFRGLQHGYADIVVGSAAQVTAKEATHTVATFVAAISAGDTVVFLRDQTHTLVRNEDITEVDVTLLGEDSTAVLAFSGFTFTMSGVRARIKDGLQLSGTVTGSLILSAAGSNALVTGAATSAFVLSGGAIGKLLNNAGSTFLAFLSTGSQTNITDWDKVEFGNQQLDTNSDYDHTTNFRFTPTIAGPYRLSCAIRWDWNTLTDDDRLSLAIYKNGLLYRSIQMKAFKTGTLWDINQNFSIVADANGTTDYFEVFARNEDRNTSTILLSGSWFDGHLIGGVS